MREAGIHARGPLLADTIERPPGCAPPLDSPFASKTIASPTISSTPSISTFPSIRHATRVVAVLTLRPNPQGRPGAALALDGDELQFVGAALDNAALEPSAYEVSPSAFVLPNPPRRAFALRIETRLDPARNTKLMGLYRSGSAYCTQCEAEGFRRIAYFLDRPDVLSTYRVRVEADKAEAPVLLANGNLESAGEADGGRHWAVWSDPFKKPCYLFALVAGDLAHVADEFVTMSGRRVALGVYVERGREERAAYAMDALKRAMAWDERAYGREYDLERFNIVAVSDFNMGAMENKGLNVFNDKYVLASPETATDEDYAGIEGVIAHEYFHNWTGNRITCRDWFQLCLKEGLTVFRDQEFSADQRSAPVKRIADVRRLKEAQFPEDAGPLAHPVRPAALSRNQQFLHRDGLSEGRRSHSHAQDADRRRRRSAPAWTSISSAATERRRRSKTFSPASPKARGATSANSSCGIRRPARRC